MRGEERLAYIDQKYRSLQELAGTLTTTIASLEPTEIIQRQIEEAARANLVALQLCRVNRDLIGSPARSLIVGKRGTISATTVSEGSDITLVNPTYTPSTITPEKYGVGVEVTYEAIAAFQFDLINDWLAEAGYAMAKAIDSDVVTVLMTPAASKGTVTATTSGVLSYDDVVAAVQEVRVDNWDPDILLINPAQMTDLLKDTKFINASAYGDRTPILRGEIGQIAGVKVVVSTQQTAGSALVLDSKRAAVAAVKRDLTVRRREEPARDAVTVYVTEMVKSAIINQDATCLIASC